jgi:hypothetical protein
MEDDKNMNQKIDITEKDLENTITSLVSRFDDELQRCNSQQLDENYWHFKFNTNKDPALTFYEFFDALVLYQNFCHRWEEAHNGSKCVVERVRDKYIIPKIHQFLKDLTYKIKINP